MTEITITPASAADVQALADLFVGHISAHPEYISHGAVQLGIEDRKGSIEAGKDADFLVFDKDLLTAEHEGFSYNMPAEVYFEGKKIN